MEPTHFRKSHVVIGLPARVDILHNYTTWVHNFSAKKSVANPAFGLIIIKFW